MPERLTPHEKTDGERWLELLGLGDLKGEIIVVDGKPVPVEQFDVLCGEHARPIFTALETLDPKDPRYEQFLEVARKAFVAHYPDAESA